MPQTTNHQGHDYEMPPPILYSVAKGTTWALWCQQCPREVVVDVIGLLERYDAHHPVRFDKAVCKGCGERLKQTGGYVIRALQFRGKMPRLTTSDGSSWRRPDLLTTSHVRGGHGGGIGKQTISKS